MIALSVIFTEAIRAPKPLGVNVTLTEQAIPGAKEEGQVFVSEKSELLLPIMLMPEIAIETLPVFVNITF